MKKNISNLSQQTDKEFFPNLHRISKKISQRAFQYSKKIQKYTSYESESYFQFSTWDYSILDPTQSPLCSKSIANSLNKKVFRCFDCMQLDTALLCYDCFVKGNHKGHTFRQFQGVGGCCDCGDSQLWNQNGFCPSHSSKNKKVNLSKQLRDLFVQQLTLVYYLYFWTVQNNQKIPQIRQQYGQILFEFISKKAEQNYEYKLLIAQLMSSSFEGYKKLSTTKDSILDSIFNLNKDLPQLKKIQKFAFSIYTVESIRAQIIIKYFKLTETNRFTWDHPIKSINFQYLTCLKTINKLIDDQRITPLQLNHSQQFSNPQLLTEIFKKYYEDLNYLRKTIASKDYFIHHFKLINVSHMAFYRKFTNIYNQGIKIDLDEYFLKTLGACMKYILKREDLVIKGMKQLFQFLICNNDQMTFSLAQERAFAIYMMAYLEGSLEKLLDENFKKEIFTLLNITTPLVKKLIEKGLKNIIKLTQQTFQVKRNSYENFFFSTYPQRNFLLHLDIIYQKILLLLIKDESSYRNIVIEITKKLQCQPNSYKLVCELLFFISKLFTDELNEIVICNNIGIIKQKQITQFYLKLLSSYIHKFNIQQLKSFVRLFINNEDLFQNILNDFTTYQQSKLTLTTPFQPIEKLLYFDSLSYYKHYDSIQWNYGKKLEPIECLRSVDILNQTLIKIQIEYTCLIIKSLEQQQDINNNKDYMNALQKIVIALLKFYLMTHSSIIQQFFHNILDKIKFYLKNQIFNHLNFLCKQKDQLQQENRIGQLNKEQQRRKKRQKIDIKLRQKGLDMKKNQQKMLKQYEFQIQEMLSDKNISQNGQLCIYCKQDIGEDYFLISYLNLTNHIAKFLKKQSNIHLFVTSCGHKVHEKCYNKYATQKPDFRKCFLCKKMTNMIIPKISKIGQLALQQRNGSIATFFDSVYAALLTQNEQVGNLMEDFYQTQNKGIILNTLLTSIVRQSIYYGLHNFKLFKRYSLPAYQLIYQLLKIAKAQQLRQSFITVNSMVGEDQHILSLMEKYGYYFLQKCLLNDQKTFYIDLQQRFICQLQKIILLISGCYQKQPDLVDIGIIRRQQLLRALPSNIVELHSLMGECPTCGKLTNWLYYCLLCDWKACNKQTDQFHSHSKENHIEGSAYISAGNGKISIISKGNVKNQNSLYENVHGQEYIHSQGNFKNSIIKQFRLSQKKYEDIYREIISHNIHNLMNN